MRDLAFALRVFRKQPIFVLTVAITLGVGIGATTAIFSVVNAVLLRPLPYKDPSTLVLVRSDLRNRNVTDFPFSNPDFADLRRQATLFESLAAVTTGRGAILGLNGEVEMIRQANATTNIFSTLGLRLEHGRDFIESDGTPPPPPPAAAPAAARGGPPAMAVPAPPPLPRMVIISHEFWRRHFGGDAKIVGGPVQLGNATVQLVGVLAPGAELLFPPSTNMEQLPDVWSAMRVDFSQGNRNNVGIRVLGRLRPGATIEAAQSQVDGIAADLRKQFTIKETAGLHFRVERMDDSLVADVRRAIWALMGAVLFVLLIACANVANLLLARSTVRERELAVRSALGAGHGRLVRQLLAESLALATGGAVLGLVLAQFGIRLLLQLKPAKLPRIDHVAIDPVVLGFTAVATIISVVIFGLVPAIRAARPDVNEVLRKAGRTAGLSGGAWLRNGVIVAEVALSFVLLIGSGLMLRSFLALQRVDPGYDPNSVLTFNLANVRARSIEERAVFVRDVTERLRALPGVVSVTAAAPLPLDGGNSLARWGTEAAAADPSLFKQAYRYYVLPGYFDAMRTRLVEGRTFTEADDKGDVKIVVIDNLLAAKAFPNESAVGKRLLARIRTDEAETFEVIGVVRHQRHESLAEEGREGMFFTDGIGGYTLAFGRWAVRTSGDPAALGPTVRAEIAKLDPRLIVTELQPMSAFVETAQAQTRFALILISVFAGIAALLAAVGLYGVLSTVVRQRTAEIGVRMAFGASRGNVFGLVVGRGLALSVAGVVVGLGAALALTRWISSMLVGVTPTDPPTFGGIVALFLAIAALACALPALRAARLDPTAALREE